MASTSNNFTVEAFIADPAFVDQRRAINGFLVDDGVTVASLTPRALTYFNKPAIFADGRNPSARAVNWTATTSAQMFIDSAVFSDFVETVNELSQPTPSGFFEIIDLLLFNYNAVKTKAQLEAALLADPDMATIYVAKSFSVSTTIVTDKVYLAGGTTKDVNVPAFITFDVKLAKGSTFTTYTVKLYTSVTAWLDTYNSSTIAKVIPPLPYDTLYNSPLTTTTANVFSTSALTATLSFNTQQALLANTTVSGMEEYRAVLTDGVNNVIVPFNILYKGRRPTMFEIRNAIKAELLGSGVGDEAGWKRKIPGVFVTGRFYLMPLWDQTFTKPDQILFPNILPLSTYLNKTETVLGSLGYGDLTDEIEILGLYYNRMQATVIPDLSGRIDVSSLHALIPDYQSYSPSDKEYAYMAENTRIFARELNNIMTVDSRAQTSNVYFTSREGLLEFYSFTVASYEICVISQSCYTTIVESVQ